MNNIHMLVAMQNMLYYAMVAVVVVTLPTLIVGLTISIIQAATQINEVTMTFIPKILVMFTLMYMFGPWLMNRLVVLTQNLLTNLPTYIR